MSSINRVLRNTINSHIIEDHKYQESNDKHSLYQHEASDGSEEDDSRISYQQPSWQPPIQIHYSPQKDSVNKIEETSKTGKTHPSIQIYHRNISHENENDITNIEQR